jgi:hypothetical protein
MSLNSQLRNATKNLNLVDTDGIVEQGRAAFRAMFDLRANPFKSDRDRKCWDIGYKAEQQKWYEIQQRWKTQERGQNA